MVAIRRRLNNRRKPEGSEDSESDVSESDTREVSEMTPHSKGKDAYESESEDEAADLDADKDEEMEHDAETPQDQVGKNKFTFSGTEETVQ